MCVMQSQPPGRKDKQRAVSVQWSCDLECCTGHHTEHDLQWRHKPAATSLLTKLWLWGSVEVCWSFHKGNCSCLWRLLCCMMWWCAVWQLVVNICSWYLLLKGMQLSCTAWVESLSTVGFGGLVVSMLASGTQDRWFEPGQSRRIFRAKKSSARLPSEGK